MCALLAFLRTELLARRRERQQRRLELSKRKSVAAQERMRILSMLAKGSATGAGGKKKEDTFGMKDEDWDIYKAVSKVGLLICIMLVLATTTKNGRKLVKLSFYYSRMAAVRAARRSRRN